MGFIHIQNSNLGSCYNLSGGTLIPDNADLYSDTYKVPGNYYCPNNVNVVTLKNCPLSKAFILKVDYTNGTQYVRQSFMQYDIAQNYQRIWNPIANKWEHDSSIITSADYDVQSITNQYGLNLHVIKFGNDSLKAIRLSGYINKALVAGTEYIIATNAALKSRVDWYHNVFVSGKGSELKVYLNIDKNGNVKITPNAAIASGTAINMMEYFV